jgi:hypothetical protein
MNPRELVDHIRNGRPTELVLNAPLRFRRRTRSNPCDFNEFLQALQSSETIRTVICHSHARVGLTEDEWVRLIKTLGSIKDIHRLNLYRSRGSRDFHPFQAVADAVSNAQSVHVLGVTAPRESLHLNQSGIVALAAALRQHTALQEFSWNDLYSLHEVEQDTSLDPVLQALPACPHLRRVTITTNWASANALRNLLHSRTAAQFYLGQFYLILALNREHWLAMADEIQRGHHNTRVLGLLMLESTSSEATEAAKAIASVIRRDNRLYVLGLQMENGFTDEAGVALAEALTVNTTLQSITLIDILDPNHQVLSKLLWVPEPTRPLVPCCASIPASI